jgi:uncharacterized protein DUF1707
VSDETKPELVALRDRREAVIQILTDSFSNDLVDVESFEERLSRAHQATSLAALDALVADLEPLPADARRAPLVMLEPNQALERDRPQRRTALALFGSVERHGGWLVPRELKLVATFGSAVIDVREANFAAGVTELRAYATFGSIEIIVPPHLTVECEGTGIFGSFEHASGAVADPDRPVLRIVGVALFGAVEIETRLVGESARDARRRRRRERKALSASAEGRALPPHRE